MSDIRLYKLAAQIGADPDALVALARRYGHHFVDSSFANLTQAQADAIVDRFDEHGLPEQPAPEPDLRTPQAASEEVAQGAAVGVAAEHMTPLHAPNLDEAIPASARGSNRFFAVILLLLASVGLGVSGLLANQSLSYHQVAEHQWARHFETGGQDWRRIAQEHTTWRNRTAGFSLATAAASVLLGFAGLRKFRRSHPKDSASRRTPDHRGSPPQAAFAENRTNDSPEGRPSTVVDNSLVEESDYEDYLSRLLKNAERS